MARRNRKLGTSRSAAPLTAGWLVFAALAVSFSLLYVWEHVQLVRTGYAIKEMERELTRWRKSNDSLELVNAKLRDPRRIERILARKQLGLGFPSEKNIVRLRYPRFLVERKKEASGVKGGTDTLLSFRSGDGGTGLPRI